MATDKMTVDISHLRLAIDNIFSHIESSLGISEISIEDDYYWNIGLDDLEDMDKRPSVLEVGQLSDDMSFLSSSLDEGLDSVSFMLVHAAPLLIFLAKKIGR